MDMAQRANHAAMADSQCRSILAALGNVSERGGEARGDRFVRLEAFGFQARGQIPRPLRLNGVDCESFPWTDVGLLQSFVGLDGANAKRLGNNLCSVQGATQMARNNDVERAEFFGCGVGLGSSFIAEIDVGATLPALLDIP